MSRKLTTSLCLALLLLGIGGSASVESARNLADRGFSLQPLQPGETFDDWLADIARKVPTFGGMFYDESGQLTMYLTETEPDVQMAAQSVLAAAFRPNQRMPKLSDIRTLPGQYGLLQLKEWRDRMDPEVLPLSGVVLTDIDEATNRLRIGVEDADAAAQVEQTLAKIGIPREAVTIDLTEPIVYMATLRDRVRPLQGGLQINFPGYLCTYGFNATRNGVAGFVTNSHCTNRQGGVESTPYWQPLESVDPVAIGTEIADPTYTRTKCPRSLRGRVCRYSDSAFAQLATAEYDLGFIEQTSALGSLTIVGSFRIVAESAGLTGQTINKVGRTTGWTQGSQTSTCVNVSVSGSNITQLCQNIVESSSTIVGGGDSGSPSFRISSGTDVALVGILWGGNQSGTLFVYSPISNIQRSDELGSLMTCAPGFSC